ncbi:hypothetical protein PFISCL1PPCAC_19030, partial [Pristionchus fissidentatus]
PLFTLRIFAFGDLYDDGDEEGAPGRVAELFEYASPLEIVDLSVDDLYKAYPSIGPDTPETIVAFKKELIDFLEVGSEEQDEIIAGSPSKFKIVPGKLKMLKEIAAAEFPTLDPEEQEWWRNPSAYLMHLLLSKPAGKLKLARMPLFEGKSA